MLSKCCFFVFLMKAIWVSVKVKCESVMELNWTLCAELWSSPWALWKRGTWKHEVKRDVKTSYLESSSAQSTFQVSIKIPYYCKRQYASVDVWQHSLNIYYFSFCMTCRTTFVYTHWRGSVVLDRVIFCLQQHASCIWIEYHLHLPFLQLLFAVCSLQYLSYIWSK